jgi:hypothetical protein
MTYPYLETINLNGFRCYWDPVGSWNKAHGDSKSSVDGAFWTQTMKGNDGAFYVRVTKKREIVLGPFRFDTEPTEEEVLERIMAGIT